MDFTNFDPLLEKLHNRTDTIMYVSRAGWKLFWVKLESYSPPLNFTRYNN